MRPAPAIAAAYIETFFPSQFGLAQSLQAKLQMKWCYLLKGYDGIGINLVFLVRLININTMQAIDYSIHMA